MSEFGCPQHVNGGPLQDMPEGFPFGPDSYIRRLAEPAAGALFPYIAGMTVMDDRIAAAVDIHSGFIDHPWGRLLGTVDSATVLVFGTDKESVPIAQRIHRLHQTIKGENEGVPYDANNAMAQTWVLACVFNGLKEAKRRWSPPRLTSKQEEGLYQDVKTFGHFFGIDLAVQPDNVRELNEYWEDRLNGGQLLQTDVSRRMANTVFKFTGPGVPNSLARLAQAISITSLDPRLQAQADLHPTALDRMLANSFDITMRNTYARIPSFVRGQIVPAYMASRRVLTALGKARAT